MTIADDMYVADLDLLVAPQQRAALKRLRAQTSRFINLETLLVHSATHLTHRVCEKYVMLQRKDTV